MSRRSPVELAAVFMLAALGSAAMGCAAIVGADFDVSARPVAAGIEGPTKKPSWSINPKGLEKLVGLSVAVEGDWALVGARNDEWAGDVFAVTRSPPDAWDIKQTLTAGLYASPNALFGSSVALSGDWAIIGASAAQKQEPGAAYFFRRSGDSWSLEQEVKASSSADGDRFGTRVAIENDVAIVGAPGPGPDGGVGGGVGGAVYIFVLGADGRWTESQRLVPPDGMPGDSFGFELALRSTTLVVGSPFNDEAGTEAGAAYVFERSGAGWSQDPIKLRPRPAIADGARMGLGTIGLEEGLLLVPALDKVEAYELDSAGDWVADTLTPPSGIVAQQSGWRASIHGKRAVLAVGTTDDVGMGLVYDRLGGDWKFVERLISSSQTREDYFGWTIAYDGATACFGAIFSADKDGAVYFFNDLSQ